MFITKLLRIWINSDPTQSLPRPLTSGYGSLLLGHNIALSHTLTTSPGFSLHWENYRILPK